MKDGENNAGRVIDIRITNCLKLRPNYNSITDDI